MPGDKHPAFSAAVDAPCAGTFWKYFWIELSANRATCFASVQVDKINSQVASRLVSCFTSWRQLDSKRQAMMKSALQRIVETNGLSDNVFEIASKALQD